ncbi:unnamed protein product [Caenorhabditis sp. 36 PRJEB53466]|nr:unnamed protein product [Caenorhabditis sp. 36 PRJEB53466]
MTGRKCIWSSKRRKQVLCMNFEALQNDNDILKKERDTYRKYVESSKVRNPTFGWILACGLLLASTVILIIEKCQRNGY